MIELLIIIGIAFYWLMIETKWLSIRLQRFVPLPQSVVLDEILKLIPIIVAAGFVAAAILNGFFDIKKKGNEQHEEDMAKLWKSYGREQPKIT